jgi:4-amino-4-deoxy-L-arabinose transferase-like glycosyltransferase
VSTNLTELKDAGSMAGRQPRPGPGKLEHSKRELRFLRSLPLFIALLSVIVSTSLIVGTYSVFGQSCDESAHLACGMQWLDRGAYSYEPLHPPLARVAAAIFPYLHGARSQGNNWLWAEGNAILEHDGEYQRNLTLARLGILPFFWLTCFLIWRFMANAFSDWQAAIAVFFVAFCPVVLGHSSVAATDAPLMAMFLASLLALRALLETATWSTAVVAGLVIGLASLTKFTELPFLACAGGTLFLYYWLTKKQFPVAAKLLLLTLVVFGLTIWAGYRFSHGPIIVPGRLTAERLEKFNNLPAWEKEAFLFPYVPADEFFRGLKDVWYQGRTGRQASYLMGQVYDGGRWYFFPTAILVKTQIPMLLFSLAGAAWLFLSRARRWDERSVFLVAGLLGPLLVGMAGTMNIGLRHVLPIYPFLAMLAAVATVQLWQVSAGPSLTFATRAAVVLLLVWNLLSCLRAAPDFLAYFNEPAAPYASAILVESDLDWGQDLKRLSTKLDQLHAQSVWISYFGSANLDKRLSQAVYPLQSNDRPAGWVAISEAKLRKQPRDYGWLLNYPYARVGSSIRLYHFAAPPTSVQAAN